MKYEPKTFASLGLAALFGFLTGLCVHKGYVGDSGPWIAVPFISFLLASFLLVLCVVDDDE